MSNPRHLRAEARLLALILAITAMGGCAREEPAVSDQEAAATQPAPIMSTSPLSEAQLKEDSAVNAENAAEFARRKASMANYKQCMAQVSADIPAEQRARLTEICKRRPDAPKQ